METALLLIGIVLVVLGLAMFHRRMQARRLERLIRMRDVDALLDMGWRVELESETHLHLINGRRVNHILHLLLTIVTAGVWGIVWLLIVLNGGETRRVVSK